MNMEYNSLYNIFKSYQVESSKELLDILTFHLKFLKYQLDSLELNKPYWFQKDKLNEYNKKKIDLEEKIDSYRKIILEEYDLNSKFE